MNGKKVQNFLLGGVIVLALLMVASKFLYNQVTKTKTWETKDRSLLVEECMTMLIQDGHAVRFPSASQDYCECQADSIMHNLSKARYNEIMDPSNEDRFEQMIQVVAPCYNQYQTEMFDQSRLD